MLEYVGPAIALLTGVIGIFYSKTGERQKLGRVGYLLLTLVALAGAASLYGVHAAKREAADKARQAKIDAENSAAQIRRERKNADTLRGMMLAREFSGAQNTADAILTFDLTQPWDNSEEGGPSGPDAEFAPLLGPGIEKARITFEITDILEIDYSILPGAGGSTIEASYYEYDAKVCRLVGTGMGSPFTPAAGTPCKLESGFVHNAMVEAIAPYRALIINLPEKQPFWKVFSRIEQGQRSGPLGSIAISTDSPATAQRVLKEVKTLTSTIKFFRPFGDGTECSTTLLLHLALRPAIKDARTVTIGIDEIRDYELNLCEINPV